MWGRDLSADTSVVLPRIRQRDQRGPLYEEADFTIGSDSPKSVTR